MTFADSCVKRLREFRWANPSLSGDAFWAAAIGVIREVYEEHHPAKPQRAILAPMKRDQVNRLNTTLAECCGLTIALVGESMARTIAIAVTDIRRACPDVTAEEIRLCVCRYRVKHPGWDCTPSSIAKWWSEFPNKKEFKKPSPYVEPPNWQQLAAIAFPTADFTDRAWGDINIAIRIDILRHAI